MTLPPRATLGYHSDRRASVDDPGHVLVRGQRLQPRMRPHPFSPPAVAVALDVKIILPPPCVFHS
jgi:hypothetical protein